MFDTMSLEGLQERLTALQETTAQLRDLIERLSNLKFTPGAVPLRADEDNTVSAELSFEISQILREEEDELEILKEEAEDLPSGRPGSDAEHRKTRLKDSLARLEKELSVYRASFRQAQLAARQSLIDAQRLEREILLKSYSEPVSQGTSLIDGETNGTTGAAHPPFRRNHATNLSEEDQQVVAASTEATRGLHRLRDNIEKALLVSNATHETLEESSGALTQVGDSYMSLDTMLSSSKELLGTLVKSQKSDTWYLQTSLYMLLITLAWLVFRRWMYGPLWWLMWLPLRLVFRTSVGVSNAVSRSGERPIAPDQVGMQEHKVSVEGLADESLPTAKVGMEQRDAAEVDPDSMMEKVGRIVEGVGDGEPSIGADSSVDERIDAKDEL
ncbi:hypothetical protein jhhlp_002296 [Lomentospora prolificans]|uniref:Sec20 C-terminal domain-containing protein n=1 Tax=Lomentospora prolificans TaxID=41688 RepID=A0A2N3NDW0_9PEZI|nr:hypothetical protein jhhlp_002296 [Lomentospora prolificans]